MTLTQPFFEFTDNQIEITKEITESISAELDEAERFALESPLPEPETALKHVYREGR